MKNIIISIFVFVLVFNIAHSQMAKSVLLGISVSDLDAFSNPFNPSSYNVSFHYFATDRIAIQVRLTWPFYNLIDYGFSIGYYAIKINNVSKAYFLVGCSQTEENYYARDTTDNKYFRGILRHFGLNFGLGFLLDGFEANQFGFLEGGFRYGLHKSISYQMPVQSQLLPNIESIDVCTFVQEGYTWSINK